MSVLWEKATYWLPEGEEDDKFDRKEFQNGSMWLQLCSQLPIELDEAIDSHADGYCFNTFDLYKFQQLFSLMADWSAYPNMRENRTIWRFTISSSELSENRRESHRNTDKAILKDTEPNNLLAAVSLKSWRIWLANMRAGHTLNHVNPLLGVLSIPLSPPRHFLHQVRGHSQPMTGNVLKNSFWSCRFGAM